MGRAETESHPGLVSVPRQALNNLQSTFSGFGFINSENVFKVKAGVGITVDGASFTCRGQQRRAGGRCWEEGHRLAPGGAGRGARPAPPATAESRRGWAAARCGWWTRPAVAAGPGLPRASRLVHTSLHADVLIILGLRKQARNHAEAGGRVQGKPVPIPGGRWAPKTSQFLSGFRESIG